MADPRLAAPCRELESLFIRSLWPASPDKPGDDGDRPSAVRDDLFREAFAQAIEASGGLGLAESLQQLVSSRS